MAGFKAVSYAAMGMAMALALVCAATYVNANGTISGLPTNSTGPREDNSSEEGLSTQLKACLIIAGVVTVLGLLFCLYIRKKAENNYAMGGNVPKPLAGMPDDY